MSPQPKPILLPTPCGPQPGITPQPPSSSSTPSSNTTEPTSPSTTTTNDQSKPKARLAEPEIVYLPAEPAPYASISDDESGAESDTEGGEVLGEDGLPKARGMLKNLGDDTDDLELTHLQLTDDLLSSLNLPRFGPSLKRLCLRQNRLTEVQPEVFGKLDQLEELDFYDNRIGVLGGFEKCTQLKTLDFSFNLIRTLCPTPSASISPISESAPSLPTANTTASSDPSPSEPTSPAPPKDDEAPSASDSGGGYIPPLSHLPNLETVYFIQNKISLIQGLDDLGPSLRSLELGGNRLREIRGLDKLVNLEELWLGKNKIRSLEGLPSLPKLKILSIQSNRLTHLPIATLRLLPALEEIYLSHNGLPKIEGLEECPKLRVLDVGNNMIEKIEGVEYLKELEEFWANHNKIPTLHSLDNLSKHANLETVYLEGNPCETNDRSGYRRKVILSLPQVKQVDATFVR